MFPISTIPEGQSYLQTALDFFKSTTMPLILKYPNFSVFPNSSEIILKQGWSRLET